MKKLKNTKNPHLKILYDCMGNQKLQLTKNDGKKEIPFYIGEDDSVEIYSSGALIGHWQKEKSKIAFIDNNGQVLFDIVKSNAVKDLQAVVCDTGVLVEEKWNNDKMFMQYYTYSGEIIVASDVKNLANKIAEFEQEKGIYWDEDELSL